MIGSRGSGETQGSSDWDLGLGPPSYAFAIALGKLLPGVEYTYNAPPGYPAVNASTVITLKPKYIASVLGGEAQLLELIRDEQTKCPSTRLILAGYSQGAELTARAYLVAIHKKAVFESIVGIVLFGDPLYNRVDPADRQTALQKSTQGALKHNGALAEAAAPWYVAPPDSFPASTIGKVLSYCLIDDYVCQGVGGNPFSHQHSHYPPSGDPEDAAKYFSDKVASAGTATPTPPTPPASTPTAALTFSGKTPEGYSARVTIAGYHFAPATRLPALPFSGRKTLAACRADATTDVVIPIGLTFVNTTPKFPAALGARGYLNWTENGQEYVELDNADGSCQEPGRSAEPWQYQIAWTPIPSGKADRADFFLVVHGYYSPAHPTGDPAFLRTITLLIDPLLGPNQDSFTTERPTFHYR